MQRANQQWPNQYKILLILIRYLEYIGQTDGSYSHLVNLAQIKPNDPEVKRRIENHVILKD